MGPSRRTLSQSTWAPIKIVGSVSWMTRIGPRWYRSSNALRNVLITFSRLLLALGALPVLLFEVRILGSRDWAQQNPAKVDNRAQMRMMLAMASIAIHWRFWEEGFSFLADSFVRMLVSLLRHLTSDDSFPNSDNSPITNHSIR